MVAGGVALALALVGATGTLGFSSSTAGPLAFSSSSSAASSSAGGIERRRASGGRAFVVGRRAARDDDDDDDADTDDVDDFDSERIRQFRARLMRGGIDGIAKLVEDFGDDDDIKTSWARAADRFDVGAVLVANEEFWFSESEPRDALVTKAALERVGLAPDARARVAAERRPSLLPVVLLLKSSKVRGTTGLLLGRRSGYMMGDFNELDVRGFKLQPLFFGGPSAAQQDGDDDEPGSRDVGTLDAKQPSGILAVHPYATIPGAAKLTEDGLYIGGRWAAAQDLVERGKANPYRFRLYAQATNWLPGELERELAAGAWTIASCATELLLKDRERGDRPIWQEIMDELELDA